MLECIGDISRYLNRFQSGTETCKLTGHGLLAWEVRGPGRPSIDNGSVVIQALPA